MKMVCFVLFHIKATLYDPKNDFPHLSLTYLPTYLLTYLLACLLACLLTNSKNRDVTPKMLFILGLRYRSHYRCYSYIFL